MRKWLVGMAGVVGTTCVVGRSLKQKADERKYHRLILGKWECQTGGSKGERLEFTKGGECRSSTAGPDPIVLVSRYEVKGDGIRFFDEGKDLLTLKISQLTNKELVLEGKKKPLLYKRVK